jgi:hypothetical protein
MLTGLLIYVLFSTIVSSFLRVVYLARNDYPRIEETSPLVDVVSMLLGIGIAIIAAILLRANW